MCRRNGDKGMTHAVLPTNVVFDIVYEAALVISEMPSSFPGYAAALDAG
jgi:hypothetical protein